ncbi:urease accessory protein UreD [Patulibacter minatonensis]|uniref:urease accessory protein UreD n=1 Tax=Patulibacter minatonensis TaxID=298163 RepID=UPI00047D8A47|nr:urease accessory protein UreD [Patulibacter minatonensis]
MFPSGTVRITDVDGHGVGELQLTNPSGGLLAGDRMETVLDAGPGVRASVVTQGANRVCGTAPGLAPETTVLDGALTVREGAAVEWAPHHLVPYARADVHQRTTVDVAPDAGLLLWEGLACGRSGRGERFAWARVDTRLRIVRDGRPLLLDGAVLGPGGEPFDGADLVATLVVVLPEGGVATIAPQRTCTSAPAPATTTAPALAGAAHAALQRVPGALAGASAPDDHLLVARVLARDAVALYAALDAVRRIARPAIGLGPAGRVVT